MNLPSITHDQTTMDASRHQNIDALQQAAKYIERCLARDNSAPTLSDHLGVSNPTNTIVTSGLSDHDYPQLVGLPATLATKTQLKTLLKVPLPVDIMKHFNHMQSHCTMGLFTEINRAWLTIDSDIYVWTYEEGGDVAYYDGLGQTILNVALIRPRAGVFQPFIKFLLVLTTAVDVIVLGVAFSGDDEDPYHEIQLVSDPVFSVPTDGAIMTTIAGSHGGRLFLGSKDGSLYEITYQAESTWFGKRCKKINHSTSKLAFLVPSFAYTAWTDEDSIVQIVIDDTRNILYTLTERGCIEVYDMGVNGTMLSKVDRVTQNELVQQATNAVRTLDSQNFYPIVSISVVELTESQRINLVAVTQTGARLYLTTTPALQLNSAPCRPSRLALLHVRLPPGFSATAHFRPRNVRLAHHRDRNALMISGTNDKEVVWSIGSDLFAFSSMLMEAYTIVELDGPVLAMSEVKYNTNLLLQPTQQLPPLLVREHTEPPKKYVILTSQGAHILIKLRPVDVLKQLLLETRGTDNDAVRSYFTMQHEDQACASSLILATLDSAQNSEVADLATSAFFIFGGEPKLQQIQMGQATPYNSPGLFMPNMMSTPMSQYQIQQNVSLNPAASTFSPTQYQQQQAYSPNVTMPVQSAQWYDLNSPFQYSSKHNGLYLHVGRILRPIWNLRCVEKVTVDGKKNYLMSTINADECLWILNDLSSLRSFLQRNTQLSCNGPTNVRCAMLQTPQQPSKQAQSTRANFTLQDAQLDERQSLDALKSFVNHSAQVLGLWKVLTDHQFHVLMDRLSDADQQFLQNTAFKDIFLYGQEICACVINTLINNYLGDNASVDSISGKLRDICPDLYKVEDAACSKANEILKVAKGLSNRDETEELIRQALALCKGVAPQINLKEICDQLTALKSYKAVVELTYTCAKRLDPENLALHFYKNSDNQESYVYYTRRMDIYKELTTMLDTVYNQNVNSQNTTTIMEDNMNLVKELIISILKYEDQLMHVAVYEWMMSKQLSNDIIKINQTTLETYLVKASQHNPNNIDILELLWKYYETNNNHAHAAKILNNLASINNPSVTLKDRVNYLTRALMCMRSSNIGYAPYLGAFLRDIENKLDVAKVQEKVLDALTAIRHQNPDIEIAISHLNLQLYEMTQLYEDFSDKFDLWECKLAIIDCSGYRDDNLIKNIWRNILQNEINRSGAIGGNDKMLQILAKVKSLVKMYLESTCCVPLEYLMSELELISAKLKADSSLVPSFFVSAGYSYEKLIEVYNALIVASIQDNFWLSEANEFRYSEAVATLLNSFINSHENYNNVEKRRIIALGQDLVASLLSNLYSKPNSDRIVGTLRGIQTRLTKL